MIQIRQQPATAYPSCAAAHTSCPAAQSNVYQIDPDGAGPIPTFKGYCDMVSAGGGWTLVTARLANTPSITLTFSMNDPSNYGQGLTDDKWVALRDASTKMLARGSNGAVYGILDIAKMKAASCSPLSDTLSKLLLALALAPRERRIPESTRRTFFPTGSAAASRLLPRRTIRRLACGMFGTLAGANRSRWYSGGRRAR